MTSDVELLIVNIAGYIAGRYKNMLPAHISLDDLRQAACERILSKLDKHDPAKSPLKSWMCIQAWYAITDELRGMSWFPRGRDDLSMHSLDSHMPGDEDRENDADTWACIVPDHRRPGQKAVEDRDQLRTLLRRLPKRSQDVFAAYWLGDGDMRSVAEQFGITESRVSQISRHCLTLLRRDVGNYEPIGRCVRRDGEGYKRRCQGGRQNNG